MAKKNLEQQWQAESDAETLARYQEIMDDKSRMSRAIKAAKARAADYTKRANALTSAVNNRRKK